VSPFSILICEIFPEHLYVLWVPLSGIIQRCIINTSETNYLFLLAFFDRQGLPELTPKKRHHALLSRPPIEVWPIKLLIHVKYCFIQVLAHVILLPLPPRIFFLGFMSQPHGVLSTILDRQGRNRLIRYEVIFWMLVQCTNILRRTHSSWWTWRNHENSPVRAPYFHFHANSTFISPRCGVRLKWDLRPWESALHAEFEVLLKVTEGYQLNGGAEGFFQQHRNNLSRWHPQKLTLPPQQPRIFNPSSQSLMRTAPKQWRKGQAILQGSGTVPLQNPAEGMQRGNMDKRKESTNITEDIRPTEKIATRRKKTNNDMENVNGKTEKMAVVTQKGQCLLKPQT